MKLSPIDLNLLVALEAIIEERSLRRAALRLGISKPAMSHALARLRAQTGDPILVRAGQGWTLSDRAHALAPKVRATVAEAFSTLAPGKADADGVREREFRIHTTDQVLSLIGIAIDRAVCREAPKASIKFLPLLDEEAGALRDDVDLAIGAFHDLPHELKQQKLFRDPYSCVVRKNHPRAKTMTLGTYVALDHVVVSPRGKASVVDDALRKRRLKRHVARTFPFFTNAFEFVAESDCVATLSSRIARKHANRYDLRCFDVPIAIPPCTVAQIWHPRVDADAGHIWLRKTIAKAAHDAV